MSLRSALERDIKEAVASRAVCVADIINAEHLIR